MAYSVNWVTRVISIPHTDLTLVSGTRYSLSMDTFRVEIRRLESAFNEGLWAPQILDHTNPKIDFAGSDYAGFDELINGYSVTFTGSVERVDLLGSNNNLIDVLNATGVSVVPSNSAGLQRITSGSGLSTAQDQRLTDVHKAHFNRRRWDKVGHQVILYDDDGVTPIYTFDTDGSPSSIGELTPV